MTGAIRVEGPEPMAGMTEEQKERAAIDLVNALHKLLEYEFNLVNLSGFVVEEQEEFLGCFSVPEISNQLRLVRMENLRLLAMFMSFVSRF